MRAVPQKNHGFSLIEVVLALGVATVALVSIIGLLSVAVDTNGASGNDTMVAAMTAEVLSEFRAAPFDALGEENPADPSNQTVFTLREPPLNSTYFFTIEGVRTSETAINNPAIYQCVVTKTPDPATRSPSTGTTASPVLGPYNLLKLQLFFTWPVGAKKPENRTIYGSIARY